MLKKRKIKVAIVQVNVDDSNQLSRFARVAELLSHAAGADLILLPELWNIGYFSFDQYKKQSETLDGRTVQFIQQKAKELAAYILSGSIIEQDRNVLCNTSILVSPTGSLLGNYRKMHLFGFNSEERQLLTSGEKIGTMRTDLGVLGLSTCFDLRFPEYYRALLDSGVETFLVSSAWPHPRLEHWKILTKARAIENQTFLAAANCVGTNRGRQYCGHSVILDPHGNILAEAGEREEIVTAEIDLDAVKVARDSFPSVSARVLI